MSKRTINLDFRTIFEYPYDDAPYQRIDYIFVLIHSADGTKVTNDSREV